LANLKENFSGRWEYFDLIVQKCTNIIEINFNFRNNCVSDGMFYNIINNILDKENSIIRFTLLIDGNSYITENISELLREKIASWSIKLNG